MIIRKIITLDYENCTLFKKKSYVVKNHQSNKRPSKKFNISKSPRHSNNHLDLMNA